jgi:hypothetical protein
VTRDAGLATSIFSHEDVEGDFWTRSWLASLVLLPSANFWIFRPDNPRLSLFSYDDLLALGDEDINTSTTIIPSIEILDPITRSRAQQLNHQVNSFLCSSAYNMESRLLPNDLIVLRNQGEDYGGQTEHQEGAGEPRRHAREGGEPIQFGIAEFEFN